MVERGPAEKMAANGAAARLRQRFPTIDDLRRRARARVPRFGFDFVDGGATEEYCIARNTSAFQAIELLPHYCIDGKANDRHRTVRPHLRGTDRRRPHGVGRPDVAGGREAVRRRGAAPAHPLRAGDARQCLDRGDRRDRTGRVLVSALPLSLQRPRHHLRPGAPRRRRRRARAGADRRLAGKSKRPRDIRNGCRVPFPINPWTTYQVLTSPAWTMQLLRNGMPITANLVPYAEKANQNATAEVMQLRSGGSHTWEELKRLRDRWKRPFVVKGILHPQDAERAVALGADGIWVSNHGGRHFDGAPASVDVLPAIVSAVGSRATVMIDSGIRGGLDVVRALALGAKFCFTGRCFAYGLGALGPAGAPHVADLFLDEIKTELLHVGARSVAEAATIKVRHPNAWRIDNY